MVAAKLATNRMFVKILLNNYLLTKKLFYFINALRLQSLAVIKNYLRRGRVSSLVSAQLDRKAKSY